MSIELSIILYAVIQLIISILATVKYVVTVKASPIIAALVATIYATINGAGTKLLTSQSMLVIIIVAVVSNLLGVLIGRFLVDKFTKSRLWVYNATIKNNEAKIKELRGIFKAQGIHSMYDTVVPDEMYILKVFSESKEASRIIKSNLNSLPCCKYHIIESR